MVWAEANTDCDEFEQWLEQLATVVAREVGDAWRENEWHTQWFERACQQKVEVALAELVKEWVGRASKLEIQALENPQLSRRSLLDSRGDVAAASQREREKTGCSRRRRCAAFGSRQGKRIRRGDSWPDSKKPQRVKSWPPSQDGIGWTSVS